MDFLRNIFIEGTLDDKNPLFLAIRGAYLGKDANDILERLVKTLGVVFFQHSTRWQRAVAQQIKGSQHPDVVLFNRNIR